MKLQAACDIYRYRAREGDNTKERKKYREKTGMQRGGRNMREKMKIQKEDENTEGR
jgi:hypothetical protein